MPGPGDVKILSELEKSVKGLQTMLSSLSAGVGELFKAFSSLAAAVHRTVFQMGAMVGLPHVFRGDLHFALAGHKKKGHAGEGAPSGAGTGAAGGKDPFPTLEERIDDIRKLHQERVRLGNEERQKQDDFFRAQKLANRAEAEERRAQRRKDKDEEARAYEASRERVHRMFANLGAESGSGSTVPQLAPQPAGSAAPASAAAGATRESSEARRAFRGQAREARQFARAHYGAPESSLPHHNPKNADYRDWVGEMLRQAALPGNAGPTPAAAAAGAPAVKTPITLGQRIAAVVKMNRWGARTDEGVAQAKNVSWPQALGAAAQAVTRTFLGLSAAAQSLVQAAGPDVFETFTKSIQLLAAQVGSTLLPFFLELAATAQEVARWFGDLSPTTKVWIGNVLKAALVVAGLTAAFMGLAAVITALITPLGLLAVIVTGLAVLLAELIDGKKGKTGKAEEMSDQEIEEDEAVKGLRPGQTDTARERAEDWEKKASAYEESAGRLRKDAADQRGRWDFLGASRTEADAKEKEKNAKLFRGHKDVLDVWAARQQGIPGGELLKKPAVEELLGEVREKGLRPDSPEFHDLVSRRRDELLGQAKRFEEYQKHPNGDLGKSVQDRVGVLRTRAAKLTDYLGRLEKGSDAGDLVNSDEVQESLRDAGVRGVKAGSADYQDLVREKRDAALREAGSWADMFKNSNSGRSWGSGAEAGKMAGVLETKASQLTQWLEALGPANPGVMNAAEKKEFNDLEQGPAGREVFRRAPEDRGGWKGGRPAKAGEIAAGMAGEEEKAGAALKARGEDPGEHLKNAADLRRYAELLAKAQAGGDKVYQGGVKYGVGDKGGHSDLLMAYANKGQPQYMAVENARKRAQISALGDDPLTAEIKRLTNEKIQPLLDGSEKIQGLFQRLMDWLPTKL